MRAFRRPVVLAAFTLVITLSGCRGCDAPTLSRPDPVEVIGRGTEAVIEIPDIGALATRGDQIRGLVKGLVTEGQLKAIEHEIGRSLGFDPTTREGLKKSGLATSGKAAIAILNGGKEALWVLPVTDEAKFRASLRQISEERVKVDKVEERKVGKSTITVLSRAWGPNLVPIAAIGFDRKLGFIGAGPNAPASVATALATKKSDSIAGHSEYQALDKLLGDKALIRLVVPTASIAAARVAKRGDLGRGPAADLVRAIRSAGWTFDTENNGVVAKGRLRLDENAKARIARVLAPTGEPPAGVRALSATDAIVMLTVAGDPTALREEVFVKGTKLGNDLQQLFDRSKEVIGLDLEKEVLAKASGHMAIAMGLGDLSTVTNLRAIMQNPASVLWTAGAIGAKDAALGTSIMAALPKLDQDFLRRGIKRKTREEGKTPVTFLEVADAPPGTDAVLMEVTTAGQSLLLSNGRNQTKAMIGALGKPPTTRLTGPGARLDVRLGELGKALRGVDVSRLAGDGASALMVRGMIAKGLMVLEQLDRAEVAIERADDGLAISARIERAPPTSK